MLNLEFFTMMKIARDERYRDFSCLKSSVILLSRSIRDYTNSDALISPVLAHVSLSKDDGDGNENGKKAIGLDWQKNNFARASRFFVHFFAVVARLRRKIS